MSLAKENTPQGRTDEPLLASKSDNEEERAQSAFEKEEKSSGNKWSILFLVAVSLARKLFYDFFRLGFFFYKTKSSMKF